MGIMRMVRYKYLLSKRRRYASLALSLALARASFGQVKYKSVGNGMADIELSLEQDQKFMLKLDRADENKNYRMKGTWSVEDNNYVLQFKRPKIDVSTLFSSNTGFHKRIKITDDKTVKFSSSQGGVVIFGIYCPRDSVLV